MAHGADGDVPRAAPAADQVVQRFFFFFNDTAPTEIYALSLHDARPIFVSKGRSAQWRPCRLEVGQLQEADAWLETYRRLWDARFDRLDRHLAKVIAEQGTTTTPGDPA